MAESVDNPKFSHYVRGTQGPDFEALDAKIASGTSWSRLWVARCENCFSSEQFHPELPLQEKGQSGGNESSQRRPLPSRKTDCLLDLRIFPVHWSQWFCQELCRSIYSRSSKWQYSGVRYKMGWNSIVDDTNPIWWHLGKFVPIVENTRVSETQDRFGIVPHGDSPEESWPEYHRLMTMVKRSIEQSLRMKNVEVRNGISETSAVVKNQRVKQREQRSLGDCWQWKAYGQCSKGDNYSFRQGKDERAKSTQRNPSPRPSTQQNVKNGSGTKSPRGRSPSGKLARLSCNDSSKALAQPHSVKNGILRSACCTKQKMDAKFGDKCSCAHRQVDEQPGEKTKKEWWQNRSGFFEEHTTNGGCVSQDMESPKSCGIAQIYWSQSDVFNSPKPCYVTPTFETKKYRLGEFAQVIPISATPMPQNLRIGLKKRQKGKRDMFVKQRGK